MTVPGSLYTPTIRKTRASAYLLEQSALFDGAAYLSRTPSSSGSLTTWTFSVWVKRGKLTTSQILMGANSGAGGTDRLGFLSGGGLEFGLDVSNGVSSLLYLTSNAVLRDSSAWYHLVYVWDTTNATSTDRGRIYVNGTRITSLASATYPSQNAESTAFNKNLPQILGRHGSAERWYDGLMALPTFIDGTALDPTSFAEEDADGYWNPIDVSDLTYGTNGGAYDFAINTAYGTDVSGNGNNFTDNGFATTDQVADTPTDDADLGIGNYCTWNPNDLNRGPTVPVFAEANLQHFGNSGFSNAAGTFRILSGKWHMEYNCVSIDSSTVIGFITEDRRNITYTFSESTGGTGYGWGIRPDTGVTRLQYNGTDYTNTSPRYVDGDRLTVEIDKDAGEIYVWINGVAFNGGANVASGAAGTALAAAAVILPAIHNYTNTRNVIANFGQKPFVDTPTAGYQALATQNLPAPTIADPSLYFETLLYTGNGSASQRTDIAFNTLSQPDFVWIKQRSSTQDHALHDSVRGVAERLESNTTGAAVGGSGFGSDGFGPDGVGSELRIFTADAQYNASGATYVAWGWKAGGTAVTNTDGTITSSVSANPTAGFSIVTWTGTGVAATVGHGLGVPNDFMIFKSRSNVSSPGVVTSALGFTKDLLLEATDAAYTRAAISNNTAPTSTVFSVGTDTAINVSGYTYVAYCWAEVEGFSKFGSYTGNGLANGPFIYTGFKPAFVIIKKSSAAGTSWNMFDNKRNPFNLVSQSLWANASDAEYTYTAGVNFTSNGFYLSGNPSQLNASAATHIYAAFAENPFQGDAGVTQARAR